MKVLLTTTSFQDTPGSHHDLLASRGYEIIRERGPLSESRMLELAGDFDGFLCGDDAITRAVLEKSLPRLKVVAKYGIGLDKVDVVSATEFKIPVTFCPGVNHTTVAEHTFALVLALSRNLVEEANFVRGGQWKRITGHELHGKTVGIVGLGRIGKEVAKRARAFGMTVLGFGNHWDEAFALENAVTRIADPDELFRRCDVVSLHTMLTDRSRHMVNAARLALAKPGLLLVNCARGEIVDTAALLDALRSGHLGGYAADVMDEEPPQPDHPLLTAPRTIITPHIGSRTYENVVRQAGMAVQNLINVLEGKPAVAQANSF
ncbi:MAG: phosphoglycerate dehydrogenase [Spartobacteria bacterium]